jgi:hypothetical protein
MFGRTKPKTRPNRDERELRCSFCDKYQSDVRKLIAGPTVFICNECVQVCVDIMADEARWHAAARDAMGDVAPDEASEDGHLLGTACATCGVPVVLGEALPLGERGFLCPDCVDAVEAAIAERTPRRDRSD